jgi:GMP synthase (glutamine-hydrolysing)
MSHGDQVEVMPAGFSTSARSLSCPNAAMRNEARNIYALQFHPEVVHTQHGDKILHNFLFAVCGCTGDWKLSSWVDETVEKLKKQVGGEQVVLGLSGGVDSSVVAVLLHKAIGDRLHCIFVDNGLLRYGEDKQVETMFRAKAGMDLHVIDAKARFYGALKGVEDPEQKRKVIGREFIEVFVEQARKFKDCKFLGQGTIYPDVIESVSPLKGPSQTIKSHHNVGGLPPDLKFELVEPLRELFKDEVRAVGRVLGMDAELLDRQPFPGPGMGVRILGEVNAERVALVQQADLRVQEEMRKLPNYKSIWQSFAVLLPVKTVGVMGDQRTYENVCVLRVVDSIDAMTADWTRVPYDTLARISNRIINEVRGINRVVFDISSKPPATIEWE